MTAPAAATTNPDDTRTYEHPVTGETLWSYSTIAGATNAKPWISRWYGRTSTVWCVDHLEEVARAKVLKGRDAAISLGQDQAERERKLKAEVGTYVHDIKEALILWAAGRGGEYIPLPDLPGHLNGALYKVGPDEYEPVEYVADYMVTGFLNWVDRFRPRFLATEMTVFNRPLGYAGTLDDIVELDGYAISYGTGLHGRDELVPCPGNKLSICDDTKTGKSLDGTVREQLAAYRRAPECMPSKTLREIRPMPPTDAGAVLHLRPEHPDGFLYLLVSSGEDEEAWDLFRDAVRIFTGRQKVRNKAGTVIRPLRPDGTMPGYRLADLADGDGYGRALAPLRRAFGAAAELTDIAEFTETDLLAFKGIKEKTVATAKKMLADHGLTLAVEETPTETPTAKAA